MKTVREACELQPNALDIHVADQVEQLDELINAEGMGETFYKRTHITQGMRDLITEGLARLAGKASTPVFHLKQAMGGGKTHLLIGFGLVATNPELRAEYFPDVTYGKEFDRAEVVAFNGRNTPDEFFWGEIARQLGRPDLFKKYWADGPKAPDEKAWLRLFQEKGPILILLDEMPPYFHYLNTQKIGNGTVADIATRAFANLLTAAAKKANVAVVISDLTAVYDTGGKLINRALEDARKELGRQERAITPVDLASNEIYDILKKRLFMHLPEKREIEQIASTYGELLEEASKAKVAGRGAEAITDEIEATYPFHPRLKNLLALFKENEQFRQTRGLIELVSRLLKSVWERKDNDVYLIGAQHFDLSLPEVRDKLTEISGMRDVIARDLWDQNQAAHAQVIDLDTGTDAAVQVGNLLLTSSLSTAVNAVKGLTREEMAECLVAPFRKPSEFLSAFDKLEKVAWYLHHTPEERYYFDRQENLTRLLETLAKDAPENQVDDLIRHRLKEMFYPIRKDAYSDVLPLPLIREASERVKRERVLMIVSPDSELSLKAVRDLFESLPQKNNFCVLIGDKTDMASLELAARNVFAAEKAETRIPPDHVQHDELERRQQDYRQHFNSTILNLFDKVLFPIQRHGSRPELRSKHLEMSRDTSKKFDGEEQVIKTLTSDPIKLYLDVEGNFDALKFKAEQILWPEGQDEVRWNDAIERSREQAAMPWVPPKGLDALKAIAISRGYWEDLKNGYISKRPKKKKTSVQVIKDTQPDDKGFVRLCIIPQNAGPAPKIHYAEDAIVTEQSPLLKEQTLNTNALEVQFLVIDPSGQYETGDPVCWRNELKLRSRLAERGGQRQVELFVAPRGEIRYTLDGSEPREGTPYDGHPVSISNDEVLILAFAKAGPLECKEKFHFPARGDRGVPIEPGLSARLCARRGAKRLDSRNKAFQAIEKAKKTGITFENLVLTIGQGSKMMQITIGEIPLEADYIETLLSKALEKFEPDTPVAMTFRQASFKTGHDLEVFARDLEINLQPNEVIQ